MHINHQAFWAPEPRICVGSDESAIVYQALIWGYQKRIDATNAGLHGIQVHNDPVLGRWMRGTTSSCAHSGFTLANLTETKEALEEQLAIIVDDVRAFEDSAEANGLVGYAIGCLRERVRSESIHSNMRPPTPQEQLTPKDSMPGVEIVASQKMTPASVWSHITPAQRGIATDLATAALEAVGAENGITIRDAAPHVAFRIYFLLWGRGLPGERPA